MSDSDWLESIRAELSNAFGSKEQKARAYKAACDMDAILMHYTRGQGPRVAALMRRLFTHWVHNMRYLVPEGSIDERLPDTMMRSDIDVAIDYGLKTAKGIQDKQERIAEAAERRVQRALDHIDAGWEERDCLCFVASKDEWRQVVRKAGKVAV